MGRAGEIEQQPSARIPRAGAALAQELIVPAAFDAVRMASGS